MLSKTSLLALLTATASAAAIPSESGTWIWHVTGATSVCTGASSCQYSFSVSAPAGPSGEPSFDATGCFGTSIQGGFKSCSVVGVDVPGDVLAQEINHGIDENADVEVRFTFEQNGIKYTYTGGHVIAHGGARADFDITPGEVFAVPVEG
ncbi:hypothetical protein DE146DRAFT_257192 [Phaeosphaeria sp. MPI-PUGE-AT-0046c]|nr:hypothetical protein DE146DRAFT_257192 [Phaeosphaeria sp. MPI-PUGE-AT-0046c]